MRNWEPNDSFFAHFKWDYGVQPAFVDPINSAFDAESAQPTYEGQLVETHLFSPNLVNQFNFSTMWYATPFVNTDPTAAAALIPYTLIFSGWLLHHSWRRTSTPFPRAGA